MADKPCALFTPLFDNLVPAVGLIPSAVFGLAWRYAHMSGGVCRAACATLGARLGLDRGTILRALQKLRDAGLLEDLTPGLRNRPHVLKPTPRALALIARVPHPAAAAPDTGFPDDEAGVAENDRGCGMEQQSAVVQSNLNQTLLRDRDIEEELTCDQFEFYRERVAYANQNLLTFNRCRPVVHCRFETIKDNCLVISHPDAWFLSRISADFRRLYEKTLAPYLPEGEVRVEFVLRENERVINRQDHQAG
jgi:DNA-binding MarR family transcriptional regulator